MLPTVEQIIEIFQGGDQDQKLAFVESCSIVHYKEQAKRDIEDGSTAEMIYHSMDFLARGCLENGQFKLAERIAESYYLLARTRFDLSLGDSFSLRFIAGRGALNWMSALQFQQDPMQVDHLIDEPLSWLESTGDADHYEELRLKKVESLLDLQEYKKALKSFKEINESKLSATTRVRYGETEYRIREFKGGKAQLPIDFNNPGRKDAPKPTAPLIEESVRQRIQQASYLLTDPVKGSDPVEILKVEPDLISGRDWMRDHRFPRAENDACWSLYLAYNRTNRDELALEQLQRIRSNIENARSQVSDPGERNRLAERFPYLYPCLCSLFYKLGRYEELMEAIEASKSRAQADLITLRTGKPVTERELSITLKELPSMLGRLNSHYFSCFVDDDCVFGALLTSGGTTRALKISIKRERIAYYASIRNPELWGQPDPIDPVRRWIPEDLPLKLSPIIELIKSSFENREIKEGDHICFSSHDVLLHLPFHYMDFLGKPLVAFFSISEIPGAYTLHQLLKKRVYVPKRYTHIDVPSIQDLNKMEKLKALNESGQWLENHMGDGTHIMGEEVDIEALANADLEKSVVHFSTHGRLPKDKASGLVLAAYHKLPDLALVSRGGAEEHVLNPERVINSTMDFSGSHITFQTCVNGHSRGGPRGNPPDLEWAFLQNGATSILSPNWPVLAQSATYFINTFYSNWLIKGNGRAEAWQKTVLELQNTDKFSHPHHWAAFTLRGDWR